MNCIFIKLGVRFSFITQKVNKMRFIIFLFTLSFFMACDNACVCKIGETNVTAVKAMYDAFAEGDVESVLAGLSPEIVWNEAENFIYADGNPYKGHDAVVEGVFGRLGAEWEYWNLEDKAFHPVGGDNVLVTGRYKAKNKASGNMLDAQFAHVWTLQDGKAVNFQQYTDTKQAAEAVLVPEVDEGSDESGE